MFGDVVLFDRSDDQRNDDQSHSTDPDGEHDEEEAFLLPLAGEHEEDLAFINEEGSSMAEDDNPSSPPNPQDDHHMETTAAALGSATTSQSEAAAAIAGEPPSSRGQPRQSSSHSLRSRKDSPRNTNKKSPCSSAKRIVRRRPCSYAEDDDDRGSDHSLQGAESGGESDNKRRGGIRSWQIFGVPLCCCSLNRMAAFVLWTTIISLAVTVVWYSYELFNHGTDPHKIAWFSAGAFVLLGFPVSMWGILGHLMNYNSPGTQVYIVRILWMVPIYSVQSWLAMRFHKQAVFIETLRDFYESYVLYSFTQFLTEVLGGEEALILMLKDKSPTRGVHMWGLQWCVKPWIMGQPVRRYSDYGDGPQRTSYVERVTAAMTQSPLVNKRRGGRVSWKSPFYIKCKFGVLQYVLIKLVCAVAVLLMEYKGWYKEGQFKWSAGYLYICYVTNISQCWALYCLIFFYYATKTELSPIRPVGKFLSVKALVFFTWWQSVFISILVQMDMISSYRADERDWTSDDVAKGIQDYLICIEMFIAAVVHIFVFPHSEYSVAAVNARANAIHPKPAVHTKRLGRRRIEKDRNSFRQHEQRQQQQHPEQQEVEMVSLESAGTWDDPLDDGGEDSILLDGPLDRPGLFKAFMDSAIPTDLRDNTFNMMKGDFNVEKKTLLHHAATSDQYDLFSNRRFALKNPKQGGAEKDSEDGGGV